MEAVYLIAIITAALTLVIKDKYHE